MGTKPPDRVETKDRIQACPVAEHQRRTDDFPSHMAFIRATAAQCHWLQRLRARRASGQGGISNVKTWPRSLGKEWGHCWGHRAGLSRVRAH